MCEYKCLGCGKIFNPPEVVGTHTVNCPVCFTEAGIVLPRPNAKEAVNHPAHYGGKEDPYEAIKVIENWNLGFALGNVVKYVSRAGKKSETKAAEDLKKAAWYLQREIERMESNENYQTKL